MSKRDLSPDSLEAQADALLAAADSMDIPDEIPMPGKSSRSGKAAKAARPEADHIMTDEEAKKAGIVRLDDKQVAALPAASWLMGQEKLRELLARGKKKGKLDSGELMETVDDLNLESYQMDQLYDSLEALNIDIGTEEDLLPELPDDEPAAEEIADVQTPRLDLDIDPKLAWALRHPEFFPVDVNRADYEALLRVPGVGVKSARLIVSSRRYRTLTMQSLRQIGVVMKKAQYFVRCRELTTGQGVNELRPEQVRRLLTAPKRQKPDKNEGQLTLF